MSITRRTAGMLTLAIGLFALSGPGSAEPTTIGADKITGEKLVLAKDEKLGGQAVRLRGETGPDAVRHLFVEGLSVMSPVALRVLAVDPTKPISIALHRNFWDRPEGTAVTDTQGNFSANMRVDGDLGVTFAADEPAEFYLLIWEGEPVEVPMPKMLFIDGKLADMNAEEAQ